MDAVSGDGVTVGDGLNDPMEWGFGIIVWVLLLGSVVSATVVTDRTVASDAGAMAGPVVPTTGTVLAGEALGTITAATFMVTQDAVPTPMGFLNPTLLRPTALATAPAFSRHTGW